MARVIRLVPLESSLPVTNLRTMEEQVDEALSPQRMIATLSALFGILATVLAAMGLPLDIAGGFVRISFGPDTGEADVDRFLAEWRRISERAAQRAA